MSCNLLTQGFEKACRDQNGGFKTVYLASKDAIASTTESSGSITEVTMATGSYFHKYELRRNASSFTETYNASEETGTLFHTQEATIVLSRLEASKRNEIYLVGQSDVVMIVEDYNDNLIVLGLDNGLVLGGSAQSGTARGDLSGYELTFTAEEQKPSRFLDDGILSGLLEP